MVKLISAKCPNCGASLKLSKEYEKIKCEYCKKHILVDDAIACYKLKVSGTVSVEGISTNSELISAANELLNMNEYLKAKRKFLEFSEKCPNDYQGWLGLLICRTRNFTIKDDNIMFENDVNKYYEHFLKVAPDEIKNEYVDTIENYLHPTANQPLINQVRKTINNKEKIKIEPKYQPLIAPIIFIILGIALLFNLIIVGGLIWLTAGIILIPNVRNELKLPKKKSIILATVLGIVGFIAFAIESPYGFEGQWKAIDDSYSIEFKDDNTFLITENNGENINGSYKHIYKNEQYIITISSENKKYDQITYKYDSSSGDLKKLCLYEDGVCTLYFK